MLTKGPNRQPYSQYLTRDKTCNHIYNIYQEAKNTGKNSILTKRSKRQPYLQYLPRGKKFSKSYNTYQGAKQAAIFTIPTMRPNRQPYLQYILRGQIGSHIYNAYKEAKQAATFTILANRPRRQPANCEVSISGIVTGETKISLIYKVYQRERVSLKTLTAITKTFPTCLFRLRFYFIEYKTYFG